MYMMEFTMDRKYIYNFDYIVSAHMIRIELTHRMCLKCFGFGNFRFGASL